MDDEHSQSRSALLKAIEILGGQSALARACRKKQGHVSHWIKIGWVPAEHCPLIEKATRLAGNTVTCEQLNPQVEWSELRLHHSDNNTQTGLHRVDCAIGDLQILLLSVNADSREHIGRLLKAFAMAPDSLLVAEQLRTDLAQNRQNNCSNSSDTPPATLTASAQQR